jgi:hypothetical protein
MGEDPVPNGLLASPTPTTLTRGKVATQQLWHGVRLPRFEKKLAQNILSLAQKMLAALFVLAESSKFGPEGGPVLQV